MYMPRLAAAPFAPTMCCEAVYPELKRDPNRKRPTYL